MSAAVPHISPAKASAQAGRQDGGPDMATLVLQLMQELKEERTAHQEERKAHREAIEEHNRMMRQILTHVHAQVKPWLSVEEAQDLVGLNRKTPKHREYLADACRRYRHGVRSMGQKPPRYYREDIERMAKDSLEGRFVIMGVK